jgi:HD-GYP domain-containing protein (c-di-GMP phosphodiesterase class II)
LALVLGQSFHFNPLELQELATAALLHDIGLLQIPPALIRRAHVTLPPLSQQERRQFRAHPRLGTIALEQQGGFTSSVLHIVGNHHPAYSGEITLAHTTTRSLSDRTGILVLVDKYDELLTGFGGSSPFAPHQAIQRLYIEAHQCGLNQTILAHFIKIVGIYPLHSYVKRNTNELAVVTGLNTETLHQPVITITHKPEGIEYQPPIVVDLAQQEDQGHPRSIESVLDGPPVSKVSGSSRAA